ncbi:MAG: hypothetical protein MI717_11660 [Spirochaetales bacterium]|nr:hypothetical protein [Spirochaetales bacterium]
MNDASLGTTVTFKAQPKTGEKLSVGLTKDCTVAGLNGTEGILFNSGEVTIDSFNETSKIMTGKIWATHENGNISGNFTATITN